MTNKKKATDKIKKTKRTFTVVQSEEVERLIEELNKIGTENRSSMSMSNSPAMTFLNTQFETTTDIFFHLEPLFPLLKGEVVWTSNQFIFAPLKKVKAVLKEQIRFIKENTPTEEEKTKSKVNSLRSQLEEEEKKLSSLQSAKKTKTKKKR